MADRGSDSADQGQGQGGKLLLVEDDVTQLSTLQRALAKYDYHSAIFASAEEALASCQPLLLDAAILDMDLPGIDGIELGRQLKENVGAELFLPVVIVSGSDALQDRLRAYRAGCDDFLTKPINFEELALRLEPLIARKRQQAELVRVNEALRRVQDNRSELAALIVHDLRNPIAAILGNAQLLEECPQDEVMSKQCLHDINELGLRALSMVNGLLDVEEMEGGQLRVNRQTIDLEEFLRHFPSFYKTTLGARKLTLEVDTQAIEVKFDSELIGRIVENLMDNAVRYAPRGGQVLVRTSVRGTDLIIEVGNSGPAIPESEHTRIFERYYRLEGARNGARASRGLGLYFCRLAAEAHGGSISVVSHPDLPAGFSLRLPDSVCEPVS